MRIVACWDIGDGPEHDIFDAEDTPERRETMQKWCDEMNVKYGRFTHWVGETK